MAEKANTDRDILEEMMDALNQMFYSVLCVRPEKNSVFILQSRDYPEAVGQEMTWTEFMERYSVVLTEEGREMLRERLSGQALLSAAKEGEKSFTLEVSYSAKGRTNWLTLFVALRMREEWCAYIFVRQSNEEHMLKRIIDLYVYNTCDYFICLDAHNNSYVMFNGSASGTPLPPQVCDDYATALVDYARAYVVPEDQEMVIQEMQVKRVLEQLERHGVHSFYCGVIDPIQGYTRKQLTYRYYDRSAQMVLLSRTDVTGVYMEERARQKELKKARLQARTDTLTGLLNYKGLTDQVSEALAEEERAALLFVDLDNFKQVNDSLGHMEGDQLLQRVARVLQMQTDGEDIQGRVGGDEFVVLLRGIKSVKQAEDCARRICEGVSRLSMPENGSIPISCSIGIAVAPEDGRDYQTLFRNADRRAYQAKAHGKNRFF